VSLNDPTAEAAGRLIDAMAAAMKVVSTYEGDHPAARRAGQDIANAAAEAKTPFSLQFVAEAAFRNKQLIPLTIERFRKVEAVGGALHNLGQHELSFDKVPAADDMLSLLRALARGALGPAHDLDVLNLKHVSWREIPNLSWGEDPEEVDEEVYCATQVVLALMDAERILAEMDEVWPWGRGLSAVRRLERAIGRSTAATAHAMETAPGPWSPARRAVAVVALLGQVLRKLDVDSKLRRVAMHAGLGLALHGYSAQGASALPLAGEAFRERLLAMKIKTRRGVEPHRLRLFALVHQLVEGRGKPPAMLGLVALAYELEAQRISGGQPLAFVDLLARTRKRVSGSPMEPMLRLVLATTGVVPPGTKVELADGRAGVVLGPGPAGDPWRPLVLVEGSVQEAPQAVRLRSP
jgi:hypothetical protein